MTRTATTYADNGQLGRRTAQAPAFAAAAPAKPYGSLLEHIGDRLKALDLLIRLELARHPQKHPTDFLSFAAITSAEVDALLCRQPDAAAAFEEVEKTRDILAEVERHIERRVEVTVAEKRRLPVLELARIFALSELEVDVLIACLAAELDRKYERIYGYLHDDMSRKLPSPGLLLSLCCASGTEKAAARIAVFGFQAPLLRYQMLHVIDESSPGLPFSGRGIRLDERIVAFLLGDRSIDGRISEIVSRQAASDGATWMSADQQVVLENVVAAAEGFAMQGGPRRKPVFYLHGSPSGGGDVLAQQAALRIGTPLLTADAEQLAAGPCGFQEGIFLLLRESLLGQAAVYLLHVDRVLDQDRTGQQSTSLFRRLVEMGGMTFLSGERPWSWSVPSEPLALLPIGLRPAGYGEQLEIWRQLARGSPAPGEEELHELVSKHPLQPAEIGRVFRMAGSLAALRGANAAVSPEDLKKACQSRSNINLGGIARRIEPKHDWADIVLPASQLEQLRSICSQAKRRSKVYGEWGFDRKLSLGKGLNALFTGPPGTGKTMAAEVIARDLGLSLYKIDLSQTVSKYIGETEKNLSRVFDQASDAHAILFFDEADALLGKRSEVKDAHDRYANTEVAYLLQKIEEYEGVAILATNLRQNMDEAFTRRMRFIVEFPFPEEDDRLRIWKSVWPKQAPLAQDVDLQGLARQFRLTGGSIRNIALAAAFLAAEEHEAVAMRHVMQATKRELQKMGRLVSDEEYRTHG
ncbi:MAG TPA: ATP-binding protein [Burkholderiales bacterium]|nr:ATP-binding protein [Burkholderiales bacterium]